MNVFVFIVLWTFFPQDGIGKPNDNLKFCPKTKIINSFDNTWTENDKFYLNKSKTRCGELYKYDVCVKVFEKYDFQAYRVTCGEKE